MTIKALESVKPLKEIQLLFTAGFFEGCYITVSPTHSAKTGYNLNFTKGAKHYHLASQRSRTEPRTFKTLEAATQTARQIGFRKVEVYFPTS